jgi:hypothetical protein
VQDDKSGPIPIAARGSSLIMGSGLDGIDEWAQLEKGSDEGL